MWHPSLGCEFWKHQATLSLLVIYHTRILKNTKASLISFLGITLPQTSDPKTITELGSQLFLRCVSGTRVVSNIEFKKISGYEFHGWGSHHNSYPTSYLTAAASIGMTTVDVEQFLNRLTKVMDSWSAKRIPYNLPFLTNGCDVFSHESHIVENLIDQESSVI